MHNCVENVCTNCVNFFEFCTAVSFNVLGVFNSGSFSKRNYAFLHNPSTYDSYKNTLLNTFFAHFSHSLLLKLLIY